MDTKKLLSCLEDQNDCSYLYNIYTDKIRAILDQDYNLNVPYGVCQEMSEFTHSQQELRHIIETRLFWNDFVDKYGHSSTHYKTMKTLNTISNGFYITDYLITAKNFYYGQFGLKQVFQQTLLYTSWRIYSQFVISACMHHWNVDVLCNISKDWKSSNPSSDELLKFYASIISENQLKMDSHDPIIKLFFLNLFMVPSVTRYLKIEKYVSSGTGQSIRSLMYCVLRIMINRGRAHTRRRKMVSSILVSELLNPIIDDNTDYVFTGYKLLYLIPSLHQIRLRHAYTLCHGYKIGRFLRSMYLLLNLSMIHYIYASWRFGSDPKSRYLKMSKLGGIFGCGVAHFVMLGFSTYVRNNEATDTLVGSPWPISAFYDEPKQAKSPRDIFEWIYCICFKVYSVFDQTTKPKKYEIV